jgi:polyphosphate kinase
MGSPGPDVSRGNTPMSTSRTRSAAARIDVRPILRQVRSNQTELFLAARFRAEILPLLTPIALDRGHPLPPLRTGTWGLVVRFRDTHSKRYGVILVHPALHPVIEAPGSERVPLEHVIATHVAALLGGLSIESCWTFQIARDVSPANGAPHDVAEFLVTALQRMERSRQEPFASVG